MARDSDDTILFAEKIQCLDRLFYQTNDARGRNLAHHHIGGVRPSFP